jgi:hypothetical protein
LEFPNNKLIELKQNIQITNDVLLFDLV